MEIAAVKRQLAIYPRDALLHVDQARLYSVLGQDVKARRAITVALGLAPTHRFVLRSASRLLVHREDAGEAHHLLRRSSATPGDPWLVAAELAVSAVAGKQPRFVRRAKEMLADDNLEPIHTSEIAAALGTLEMSTGAMRNARKLLRRSMIQPTDNTVAQVQWAARELGMPFPEPHAGTPISFEANAISAHMCGGPAAEILTYVQLWCQDEPFSSRPFILGSYTAAARLDDHEQALRFCTEGLVANPTNHILKNNKVLSLAKLGRREEAGAELKQIKEDGPNFDPVIRATEGLMFFAEGDSAAGHKCYLEAIRRAQDLGNRSTELRARAYFLEERVWAGETDLDAEMQDLTLQFAKSKDEAGLAFWNARLSHIIGILNNRVSNAIAKM